MKFGHNPQLQALILRQVALQYPGESTPHHKDYRRATAQSDGEEGLWFQITKLSKVPHPEREVCLVEGRGWRCDFVWKEKKLVVEIEGGIHVNGRHNRPKGFQSDMKKYREIEKLGYSVVRFSPEEVKKGEALSYLEDYFQVA